MTRTKVLVTGIVLVVVALSLDWHLYFFDRPSYLFNKSVEKCTDEEMAKYDYFHCKSSDGYPDKRECDRFRAIVLEKAGECIAATAASDAEFYRRRTQ